MPHCSLRVDRLICGVVDVLYPKVRYLLLFQNLNLIIEIQQDVQFNMKMINLIYANIHTSIQFE